MDRFINVIMILPHVEAMSYGIGSYVSNLEKAVSGLPMRLHIVKPQLKDIKEFTIEIVSPNVYYINIPLPQERYAQKGSNDITVYVDNVTILLYPYLRELSNCVYQVNFSSAMRYVMSLRKHFKYPIVSVVHFAPWHFILQGNIQHFNKILKRRYVRRDSTLDYEKEVLDTFFQARKQYLMSAKIIVINEDTRKSLQNHYRIDEKDIALIRNGISLREPSKSSPYIIKKRMFIEQGERIILYVGRVTKDKGVDVLIKAFRLLLRSQTNLTLIIVGDVNFKEFAPYCRDIWNKVIFTGYLPAKDLQDLYSIADVGVVPSLYEQCGYSALEMMQAGIPIVTTNAVGLEEIFQDNYNSLIAKIIIDDSGNISIMPEELCEKIKFLLSNPSLAKKLIKNAKETLRDSQNAKKMARQMYDIYSKVVFNEDEKTVNSTHFLTI